MGVATMSSLPGLSKTTTTSKAAVSSGGFHLFRVRADIKPRPMVLGILAFDAAKTMSRLVALYKSLTDAEFARLRKEIIRSEGVAYLNSRDECLLINLACAERLEDLEGAADAVSRLCVRCSDRILSRFDLVYADLKHGLMDIGKLDYGSRKANRNVQKIEKYLSKTASLYSALESLAEMETSERKLKQWKKSFTANQLQKTNFDLFESKITFQRKQVRSLKDVSLWNKTFDKVVGLMANLVCVVYARICVLFGPYISDLPSAIKRKQQQQHHIRVHPEIFAPITYRGESHHSISNSGPITSTSKKSVLPKFYSRELNLSMLPWPDEASLQAGLMLGNSCVSQESSGGNVRRNNVVFHSAALTTVGGAGLALRYANVIMMAERFLQGPGSMGDDARGQVYEMLPAQLREKVRAKLRGLRSGGRGGGREMAEGWREAVERMMGWLGPMAEDTMRWQAERNMEKQRPGSLDAKGRVLLIQTLHFADLEKTEAAIVEVLVGLSCIYRYEDTRSSYYGSD
ncbi:protein PSK SIMULATOR 1-like [Rhodamnia argentea]|uniref:Protein PSK SIMULATOR 1-like n=1 Tax=Rhodamnia argentea TaxID=178133 RepID=A0A8B8P570_9MYRT|nr:protein PSK SIMULATOR 1-like [Rhodamnia argentea]